MPKVLVHLTSWLRVAAHSATVYQPGVRKRISQNDCRREVLRLGQQAHDAFAQLPSPLSQLLKLPFSEREESRFSQRKEKTDAGEDQHQQHRKR